MEIDRDAFTDWVTERRTALGLAIAGRVGGDPKGVELFCAWDPVMRAALDGRGVYRPGDPVDQYLISGGGAISPGTQTFPIQNRLQIPPTETSIGVRLIWNYSPPAGIFPKNMQIVEYAVMKAAPVLV